MSTIFYSHCFNFKSNKSFSVLYLAILCTLRGLLHNVSVKVKCWSHWLFAKAGMYIIPAQLVSFHHVLLNVEWVQHQSQINSLLTLEEKEWLSAQVLFLILT